MPDYKCVFNFFSSGKKGGTWSETWYRNATNMVGATTFPPSLLLARMLLASPLTQLTKIRVSQVGSPRTTAIVQLNLQGIFIPATTPAPIDSAIVCNVSSSIIPATRRWWLRGWDASLAYRSQTTGNDVFTSLGTPLFSAWFNALANNGFEILPIIKNTVPNYTPFPVTKVDGAATPGLANVYSTGVGPIGAGSTVILSNFSKKDLPGLNGRWTVVSVGAGFFTISYVTPENQVVTTLGARMRQLGYVSGCTIDPSISNPSFIGGRQTKSPFTGSRGARNANRKLRLSP